MKGAAKVLIVGMANSGKTSLVKSLKNAMVVSRDGKPFPLQLAHFNVPDYDTVNQLLDMVEEKLQAYEKKFKKQPDTIVFDSVSRIFSDIEVSCGKRFSGFEVWSNVNREINLFVQTVNDMLDAGYNVVLIAHAVWDEKAQKFVETCKGNFAKVGGFLSTVDYAINVEVSGNKHWVTHKGNSLSRTLLDNMPNKQPADEFDLQDYIEKIKDRQNKVVEQWSL